MNLRETALAGIGLFVVQMAWAGPYDEPYGTIEMGDRSETRRHEPATINKIDGNRPTIRGALIRCSPANTPSKSASLRRGSRLETS